MQRCDDGDASSNDDGVTSLSHSPSQLPPSLPSNYLHPQMTPLALLHFMTLKTLMSREAAATLALVQTTRLESEAKAAARQDFLRYIVHEIRVPFNSIALGLDNLTATPTVSSDPQLISDVSFMQTAADGMTQILNDTLDVEKLDSGKFSLELCESDIQTVVARAVHSMSLGARDARVIINTSLDPALPSKVLTDPNRLRQVLSNFISNAIKFSPHDGGGIVTIAARPIARPEQLPAGFVAGQGGAGRGQAGAAADGGDDAATRRAPWYATWCCMRCYNASPHAWQSVGAAFTVLDRWIVNASNRVADWYCDVCESLWDFIVRLACLVFCCTRKMRRQLAAVQPAPQLPTDSPSAATAFGTPSAQLVPVDVEHGQQAPPSPQLHLLTADQAQTHFDPTPHVEGPRATPNTATSTTLTDTARTVTNATADLPTVRTVAPPSLAVAPQQQQQQRQQQSDLHYDDRGDEDGPVCYRRVSNAARCRVNLVQYHDVNEIGRRPSPPPRSSGTRFSTAVAAVGATPSPSPMSGALAPPRSPASSLAGLGLRRRGAGTIRSLPHSEPSGSSTPRPRGRNNSLVQAVDPSATSYMYSGDALEIQWVRLEVTDNGIGVSATDQSKLFKAFGQIQAGKLQEGKGTGLGLYICSQLTLRLGGRIGSVSSEGKGSTFFVELPLPVIEGPASSLGGFGASDSVAVRIPGGASSGAHAAPPTASTIPTLVLPSPATTAPSSSSSSSLPAPPPTVPSLPSEQPVPVLPRIVEEESAASSAGSADSATLAAGSPPATSNAADAVAAAASDAGSLAGQSLSPRAAPPAAIAVATVRSLSGSLLGIELPPIVRGARPAVTALPSPVGAPAGTRTLYPRRILIVDDDRLSRAFLGRALSRHFPGAIISEAADGFEAVDLIRVHLQSRRNEESSSEVGPAEALALPSAAGHGGGDGIQIDHPPTPDRTAIAAPTPSSPPSIRLTPIEVICMDNNMPRLGGLEAATRIRQAGFSQAIIGVTGEAGPEAAEDFVRAGANAVVAKPVATDSLVAAIRRVGEALGHRTA